MSTWLPTSEKEVGCVRLAGGCHQGGGETASVCVCVRACVCLCARVCACALARQSESVRVTEREGILGLFSNLPVRKRARERQRRVLTLEMASLASSAVSNCTKPKPRELPWSSIVTCAPSDRKTSASNRVATIALEQAHWSDATNVTRPPPTALPQRPHRPPPFPRTRASHVVKGSCAAVARGAPSHGASDQSRKQALLGARWHHDLYGGEEL